MPQGVSNTGGNEMNRWLTGTTRQAGTAPRAPRSPAFSWASAPAIVSKQARNSWVAPRSRRYKAGGFSSLCFSQQAHATAPFADVSVAHPQLGNTPCCQNQRPPSPAACPEASRGGTKHHPCSVSRWSIPGAQARTGAERRRGDASSCSRGAMGTLPTVGQGSA